MTPRLGLVCISERLSQQKITAKTMTRKQFCTLGREAGESRSGKKPLVVGSNPTGPTTFKKL